MRRIVDFLLNMEAQRWRTLLVSLLLLGGIIALFALGKTQLALGAEDRLEHWLAGYRIGPWGLAAAVLVSGFCALTLSPMMASRVLKPVHGTPPRWSQAIERGLNGITQGYQQALIRLLPWRKTVVVGALGLLGLAVFLLTALPKELSPIEDRGIIIAAGSAPEGSTPAYLSRYTQQVEGGCLGRRRTRTRTRGVRVEGRPSRLHQRQRPRLPACAARERQGRRGARPGTRRCGVPAFRRDRGERCDLGIRPTVTREELGGAGGRDHVCGHRAFHAAGVCQAIVGCHIGEGLGHDLREFLAP